MQDLEQTHEAAAPETAAGSEQDRKIADPSTGSRP